MSLIEEALRRAKVPVPPATPSAGASPASPGGAQAPPTGDPKAAPSPAHSWEAARDVGTLGRSTSSPALSAASGTIAVLALLLGLAAVGWWRTMQPGRPGATPSAQPAVSARALSGAPTLPPTGQTPPREPAGAGILRHAPAESALVLGGIVEGSGAPYAVIGDTIVTIGDTISGMTVEAIGGESVTLRDARGKVTTLNVPR